jgi:hypothetical protein
VLACQFQRWSAVIEETVVSGTLNRSYHHRFLRCSAALWCGSRREGSSQRSGAPVCGDAREAALAEVACPVRVDTVFPEGDGACLVGDTDLVENFLPRLPFPVRDTFVVCGAGLRAGGRSRALRRVPRRAVPQVRPREAAGVGRDSDHFAPPNPGYWGEWQSDYCFSPLDYRTLEQRFLQKLPEKAGNGSSFWEMDHSQIGRLFTKIYVRALG